MSRVRLVRIGIALLTMVSLDCYQSVAQTALPAAEFDRSDIVSPEDFDARLQAIETYKRALEDQLKKLEVANSPKVSPATKLPTVTLSGVFQADAVAFDQDNASRDAYGRIESGTAFRRARLGAKGSAAENVDYFMQMDFAFFGRPTFTETDAVAMRVQVLRR